jgi:hypothetical protein
MSIRISKSNPRYSTVYQKAKRHGLRLAKLRKPSNGYALMRGGKIMHSGLTLEQTEHLIAVYRFRLFKLPHFTQPGFVPNETNQ